MIGRKEKRAMSWGGRVASSLSIMLIGCHQGGHRVSQNTPPTALQVGQVWQYHTRAQERASTLTIVKIDPDRKLGNIIHIRVQGLKMKSPRSKHGFADHIAHLPLSEEAVHRSVTMLMRDGAGLPHYEEGYKEWRRAFDSGEAGVFTISVPEAVDAMEHVLTHAGRQVDHTAWQESD
jgi:hypothetical protein